jgi:hypothetical protein
MADIAPWATWWQDDLPCLFTRDQAAKNHALLVEILDGSWLSAADHLSPHSILSRWANGGAGSFLEVNALADDVRLVRNVPGFETVLHDLKTASTTESAWHVVHGAALFERRTPGSVVQFFPQTDVSLPDFLLRLAGADIPVEAKLLTRSQAEQEFNRYGQELTKRIFEAVLVAGTVHPMATLVFKDSANLPPHEDVLLALSRGRQGYRERSIVTRHEEFNIFFEPPPQDLSALSEYRSCHVLCKKSDDEDLRVEDRGKKASSQLRAYEEGSHAGLFLLGVTSLVEPRVVAKLLQQRFDRGFFSGISGAVMVERGSHLGPPVRSVVDLVGSIRNNVSARVALPRDLGIRPLGLSGRFAPIQGIPAYRVAKVEGRPKGEGGVLFMPDVRVLTPELLE